MRVVVRDTWALRFSLRETLFRRGLIFAQSNLNIISYSARVSVNAPSFSTLLIVDKLT